MASTVIFRQGYPSSARPVQSSVSVAPDGLVSASATFLVSDGQQNAMPIDSQLSPGLFSGLRSVSLQESILFVESRTFEKVAGLLYLNIGAVGALNPPPLQSTTDISPRSFSKTFVTPQGASLNYSFDYLAETNVVRATFVQARRFPLEIIQPKVVQIFNRRGAGNILSRPRAGINAGTRPLTAYPRILISETIERRSGIARVSRSAQFIYE
jgi:hypothetical protein